MRRRAWYNCDVRYSCERKEGCKRKCLMAKAKAKADGIEDCRKLELAVSEKVVRTGENFGEACLSFIYMT
jgi:hypothetical protein